MSCDHRTEAQAPRRLGVHRIETDKIAVIDKLAAGLAAGVETRIALRSLAMKRQQSEPFDRARRWRLSVSRKPDLQNRFADGQEFVGRLRRGGDKSGVRQRHNGVKTSGEIVKASGGSLSHQPRPFARSKSDESEKFSCTPTLRGERPRAMPRSCVKYRIFTEVLRPKTFSART